MPPWSSSVKITAGQSAFRNQKQMKIANIAERAAGYGIPGITVDGFDPVAVFEAVREAMDRARNGGGPTIVEAKCYRFLSHTTDDDDRTYRSREEVEQQRSRDPVPTFEKKLIDAKVLDSATIETLKAQLIEEIDIALEAAAGLASPSADELTVNVYEGDHQPWR